MKFVVSGGTGFIGSHLLSYLSHERHEIVVLTRLQRPAVQLNNATVRYVQWNPYVSGEWMKEIDGAHIVVNLVGKNVAEERWNERVKEEIFNSRIVPTRLIVEAIGTARTKPQLLLSASAVGFYGNRGDEIITEESSGGDDYLAYVVQEWEQAAYQAERFGVRVATPRTGLVLANNGGLVAKMRLPFKFFLGGPIGWGKQFLPWIHIDDVVRGMLYPVEYTSFSGVYNLVSPHPVTMKEFAKTFGGVLRRPSWAPVPPFVLTAMFGEGGKVILSGQRAVPKKLSEAGFKFSFTDLREALHNILSGNGATHVQRELHT